MFGKQKKDSLLPPRYKYIKDYGLQTRLDTRGRERQTAVYKGPYFLPLHSDETFRIYRISVITAAVLILGAAFVLLFFDRYTVYRHEGLYTLIPLTVALFPFAYMLLGFFRMPRKNERMHPSFSRLFPRCFSILRFARRFPAHARVSSTGQ